MRTLISVVALFVLFGADAFGAIGSWPKTTTYTRQFLGATNADAARAALGIVATNSDVLTVNETNSTSVTNLVGRIVASNNIVVGTIGTNLLSQSAYEALVGGGGGGSGDAMLAGYNTWTGSNVFNGLVVANNMHVAATTGDYFLITNRTTDNEHFLDFIGEAGQSVASFAWDDNGSNGITSKFFYGSGAGLTNLNASNILTGTIAAARLPVVWTNAVAADGVQIEGVGMTNGSVIFSGNLFSGNITASGTIGALDGAFSANSPARRGRIETDIHNTWCIAGNQAGLSYLSFGPSSAIFPANGGLTNFVAFRFTATNDIGMVVQAGITNPTPLTFTVNGNVVATNGLFTGSGAGLTNLPYDALSEAAKASITNAAAGGAGATIQVLDCSEEIQTFTPSTRTQHVLLKSNANFYAEIVLNGSTNFVGGALTWIDLAPVGESNWIIRY